MLVYIRHPITKKVLESHTIDVPDFDPYQVRIIYCMTGADSVDILRERAAYLPPRLLEMAEEFPQGEWYGN